MEDKAAISEEVEMTEEVGEMKALGGQVINGLSITKIKYLQTRSLESEESFLKSAFFTTYHKIISMSLKTILSNI